MTSQGLRRDSLGFTLMEVLIFIVVVGVGLAGVLAVINQTVGSSADPMVRKQAIAIAESTLEEVMLKSFGPPDVGTPCVTSGSRALFNCVTSYNGYSTSGGIVDPVTGVKVAGLEKYDIQSVAVADPGAGDDARWVVGQARKITVVVTGPNVRISLSAFRGNY